MTRTRRTAVIIGAGPAGLTAALELIRHTDIVPIVIEAGNDVGGISRTVEHNGNRIDIGGHRFFSKSDWVMNWWREILPYAAEGNESMQINVSYRNKQRGVTAVPEAAVDPERCMLVRPRLSRIYFKRKFFDYPLKLNARTLANLGAGNVLRVGVSYLRARLFPIKPERNLEDFIINRFGRTLYSMFFRDYTEKVWGKPCIEISAEWGAQRIKGLSISEALRHALRKALPGQTGSSKAPTSLIERFLYPKYGPGQMWREVANRVVTGGGEIRIRQRVVALTSEGNRIASVTLRNDTDGKCVQLPADFVFSTMPVKELINALGDGVPHQVRDIVASLPYRDFITVGLLLRKMRGTLDNSQDNGMPPDNWIYVQESDVRVGRLQVFNNWSPGMVKDPSKIWLGLEYFCREGDDLWLMEDEELRRFATNELIKLDLLAHQYDVIDSIVIRVPKAYPAYFGSYRDFAKVRSFVDGIDNLFLIGRNGMHKYNNQDHSMLTARAAVENIVSGRKDKENIWAINVDDEYHEEK